MLGPPLRACCMIRHESTSSRSWKRLVPIDHAPGYRVWYSMVYFPQAIEGINREPPRSTPSKRPPALPVTRGRTDLPSPTRLSFSDPLIHRDPTPPFPHMG